jgi:hypothetical protein
LPCSEAFRVCVYLKIHRPLSSLINHSKFELHISQMLVLNCQLIEDGIIWKFCNLFVSKYNKSCIKPELLLQWNSTLISLTLITKSFIIVYVSGSSSYMCMWWHDFNQIFSPLSKLHSICRARNNLSSVVVVVTGKL